MPDPLAPTETPPSVELDTDGLSAALAASTPQIGTPPGVATPDVTPAEVSPAVEEQPKAVKTTSEKKRGLDALAGEKKEEPKPEDKKPEETIAEPEVDTSKWGRSQQEAFASMRQAKKRMEEQAKTAQMKAERLEKELQAAKANPKDRPETEAELQRLRNWEKALEVEKSDEWKTAIDAPVRRSLATLGKIAERAKIDPAKLEAATDIEDEFDRLDAITELFDAAEVPVSAHLVNTAIQEANNLHPIYAKAAELKRNAQETLSSLNHQTEQQKAAAARAADAEYSKHHEHIYGQLAEKMPSIFGDTEFAAEVKAVRPGTDPADRAYEAQAAAILPKVWERCLAAEAKADREMKAKLALLGTRATVTPTATPLAKPLGADDTELDEDSLADALRTIKSR
jgi:hypothetical protein